MRGEVGTIRFFIKLDMEDKVLRQKSWKGEVRIKTEGEEYQ